MEPLAGLTPDEMARLIPYRPILVAYRGSLAHGTYMAPEDPTGIDDKDVMAVYTSPLRHYFGLDGKVETGHDCKIREWDCAAYDVRHYIRLALNANPNVLSLLWTPPLYATQEGEMLIAARSLFASKRAYHSFGGYAQAQLKRMTALGDLESRCGCTGNFHEKGCAMNAERGRGSTKRFATGFMGAKRKALVERFGFDTKNAAHLVRLLRMGIEFLRLGEVLVDRTGIDADSLREIKAGKWTLKEVQDHAEALFEEIRTARDESTLPAEPDERLASKLATDILCWTHATEVVMLKRGLEA